MANVSVLSAYRASLIAQGVWTAYNEHAERLRLLGLIGPCLATTDDGDHVLVDLAACMTVAHSLPRLVVSALSLQQLRAVDPAAFRLLTGAITAYFSSRELRDELGRVAVLSFEQLQAAMADAA